MFLMKSGFKSGDFDFADGIDAVGAVLKELYTIMKEVEMNNITTPNDPPFKNGIYYYTKKDNPIHPTRCELFDDEELLRISVAAQIMEHLFKNLERSSAVRKAFDDFINETKKPKSSNMYEVEEVDRLFRFFITEWKMYTEHWKKYIFKLEDSVFPKDFAVGFQQLYNNIIDSAFKDPDFVMAHTLRNYVSHSDTAIQSSHIDGISNKYKIHRVTLERFLKDSISKLSGKKKRGVEEQLIIIEEQDELIDLAMVAEKAMVWLDKCETVFMTYQIEPQLIQSCNILAEAKQRIDKAGIASDVWEIWSLEPFCLDQASIHSFTIRAKAGEPIEYTYYNIRLNWIGYNAVISYIIGLANKITENNQSAIAENEAESNNCAD